MLSKIFQELVSKAQAVAQNATGYSSSVDFRGCVGNAAMVIISTAGSITVTQQCSWDNITFYDPTDASGTAVGSVKAAQTVTTGIYIAFTPVLAPYARFKIVEGNSAATAVTLRFMWRAEG
jgi:hypothetical protein